MTLHKLTDKESSAQQSLIQENSHDVLTATIIAGVTSVILSDPHIVCLAPHLGDEAPHFPLISPTQSQVVIINTLSSIQNIAKWKLWDQPHISSSPFQPEALPSSHNLPCSVQGIPGSKNLGLVATRFIKAGELIISEKPPFVLNLLNLDEDTYMDDGVTQQSVLSLLTSQCRESYLFLHNCFRDKYPLTSGILRTNYLPVDVTPMPDIDDPCSIKGIFPHLCRVNHSCLPNASYFFDVTTFSGQFWAA